MFYISKRLTAEAGVDLKFLASLVTSQLSRDVESKIKETVELLVDAKLMQKLLVGAKCTLIDHGHALDKGSRDVEQIVKVASISDELKHEQPDSDKEDKPRGSEQTIAYT